MHCFEPTGARPVEKPGLNTWNTTILSAALWLMVAASTAVHADRSDYDKVVYLWAETGSVRAEHHHDWIRATHDARWKMISTTRNPFTADNDYSYLLLRDKATGTELFRRPVPALTYIWISPNSKYVVGVSNVMLWNPYQLVVFCKSGDRLLERNMVGVKWPGVTQSVTNWINWYKEPVPQMTIVEDGTPATLSVEEAGGVLVHFQFPPVHCRMFLSHGGAARGVARISVSDIRDWRQSVPLDVAHPGYVG